MYRIDYSDYDKLYRTAVEIMSKSREVYGTAAGFSVILDKEHKLPEGDRVWIEGECPDWITFCGELRLRGMSKLIEEIEWLESKIYAVMLERNLMASYNDGDKEGVELCLKAMNGVIGKSKLGLSKGDSDRKNAEMLWKVKRESDELAKYDTKKLEEMLEAVKKGEDDGDK